MRFLKKLITGSLSAVMILTMTLPALADTQIDESVFIKQSARGKCTLASAAMVLRSAAYLSGDEDWEEITESSVGNAAWIGGAGLSWSFSYGDYTMVHDYVSSTYELAELLEAHPEGIVAYDSWSPHAIFLTDYDEETGTFYCADPSEYAAYGEIPVSESLISAENVDVVWYLSEPVTLAETEEETEAAESETETEAAAETEAERELLQEPKVLPEIEAPVRIVPMTVSHQKGSV